MFTILHLVNGIGPQDLYTYVNGKLPLPLAYRPTHFNVSGSAFSITFPGSDETVTLPNGTIIRPYGPITITCYREVCITQPNPPQRCEGIKWYKPWHFIAYCPNEGRSRERTYRFRAQYSNNHIIGTPTTKCNGFLIDFWLDCYPFEPCERSFANGFDLYETHSELFFLWCQTLQANRQGVFTNNFVTQECYRTIENFSDTCSSASVPLNASLYNTSPSIITRLKPTYDSTKFVCIDTPTNLQFKRYYNSKPRCCEIKDFHRLLQFNLVPIVTGCVPPSGGCPPNSYFDSVSCQCKPKPNDDWEFIPFPPIEASDPVYQYRRRTQGSWNTEGSVGNTCTPGSFDVTGDWQYPTIPSNGTIMFTRQLTMGRSEITANSGSTFAGFLHILRMFFGSGSSTWAVDPTTFWEKIRTSGLGCPPELRVPISVQKTSSQIQVRLIDRVTQQVYWTSGWTGAYESPMPDDDQFEPIPPPCEISQVTYDFVEILPKGAQFVINTMAIKAPPVCSTPPPEGTMLDTVVDYLESNSISLSLGPVSVSSQNLGECDCGS